MFFSSTAISVQTRPMLSVSDSQQSLCGCLLRPLLSLGLGAPFFSLQFYFFALHCSVLHFWTQSFFVIVPADECLAILSSEGLKTGWTNDLGSFVPSLKGIEDSVIAKGSSLRVNVKCTLFTFTSLLVQNCHLFICFIWKLYFWKTLQKMV